MGAALGFAPLCCVFMDRSGPVSEDTPVQDLDEVRLKPVRGPLSIRSLEILSGMGFQGVGTDYGSEGAGNPVSACQACGRRAALTVKVVPLPGLEAFERLCLGCLHEATQRRVAATLDWFGMVRTGDKVLVSISGGKDSALLLTVLARLLGPQRVEALAIDEGVSGYSASGMQACEALCAQLGVPLHIITFRNEAGMDLPALAAAGRLPPGRVCGYCSALKKRLTVSFATAKGFGVIARGETRTDFTRWALGRQLRGLPPAPLLPRRTWQGVGVISPLLAVDDIETATQAYGLGLPHNEETCPYSVAPGATRVLEEAALAILRTSTPVLFGALLGPTLPEDRSSQTSSCFSCGLSAAGREGLCRGCRLGERLTEQDWTLMAHPLLRIYSSSSGSVALDPYSARVVRIEDKVSSLLHLLDGQVSLAALVAQDMGRRWSSLEEVTGIARALLRDGWVRLTNRPT